MLVVLALRHTIEIKGRTRRVVYADDRLGGSTATLPNSKVSKIAADRLRVTAHVSRMRWRRFGGRATAAGFWQRVHAWFAAHGTSNGPSTTTVPATAHGSGSPRARRHRRDPKTHPPLPAPDQRDGGAFHRSPLSGEPPHL